MFVSPESPWRDELSQAPSKGLSSPPQPHAKVPVSQQAAVQKAIIPRHCHVSPPGEKLMPHGTAEEIILDDKTEPKVLDISLVTLDLEQAAVKLWEEGGGKRGGPAKD